MEYIIEKILLDSEKHEASIVCSGSSYLITQADYEDLGISEGDSLDEESFERLCEADTKLSCIKKAFTYLSYGDMSARKLSDKLRIKFDKHIVGEVIELLKNHGYIDDAMLAEKFAKSFYDFKHWGPGRIKSDLYARGFSKEDIDSSCAFLDKLDHREQILLLVYKKFGRDAEAINEQKQKVSAYLYRMGYSYSDISDVLNSIEN
jgi:regulatory protein